MDRPRQEGNRMGGSGQESYGHEGFEMSEPGQESYGKGGPGQEGYDMDGPSQVVYGMGSFSRFLPNDPTSSNILQIVEKGMNLKGSFMKIGFWNRSKKESKSSTPSPVEEK
ncbi:hypothetical protein RRG08_013010 [Elysia crispata]|uniref:Uncharacterized protein n=1 Tax=Elysia crispata TaxID=231223 RepID=A0AAE1DQ40_9GAST|nr:hypothetical protein RRG08_013010 [Elysia crispata]